MPPTRLGYIVFQFFDLICLRTMNGVLTEHLSIETVISQFNELLFQTVDATLILLVNQVVDSFGLSSVRRTELFITVDGNYICFLIHIFTIT